MPCPALPRYAGTPFAPSRGIMVALVTGSASSTATIPPAEGTDHCAPGYTHRDMNELVDRGYAKLHKRRRWDNAWIYALTPSGRQLAADMLRKE